MKLQERTYREMTINSSQLIIPRETYQRELNPERVRKIVKEFDERVANEPKVSCRKRNPKSVISGMRQRSFGLLRYARMSG